MTSSSETETLLARSYQIVACPRCRAKFRFNRHPSPLIDQYGFENYHLECKRCYARLLGIVDPRDDKLVFCPESIRRRLPKARKAHEGPTHPGEADPLLAAIKKLTPEGRKHVEQFIEFACYRWGKRAKGKST
jgi:hypothetical protein